MNASAPVELDPAAAIPKPVTQERRWWPAA